MSSHRFRSSVSIATVICLILISGALFAQNESDGLLREMKWRCIGPANFSGRIVDVEALDNDFRYVICASASGGVWKSVNAGTTWEPIFNDYPSASIGDIKIFQKDPDIIWVGTGEGNNRNSVAWGDGIYKTTDGGKTFKNMGLRDTYQISRIVTHPDKKNTVYVAAIGNLWGYDGDRGLFKTTNGGKTWTKLTNGLPDDGKTGATDLVMDPRDPDVLYVAFYQRLRKPYTFHSGGPNGGIFKTTDGGKNWTKLTKGLPGGDTGRIGLDIYRSDPDILVALVEHGFQPGEDSQDFYDMKKLGTGIYRTDNGGKSWKFMNRYNNRPFYYSKIRINPLDDKRVYALTTTIRISKDGGKTFLPGDLSFEGGLDFHAMWIDPNNKDRYYLGKDKGLTLTHDHGETFSLYDNMPIGQFYAIGIDHRDPYYVYGGTQDNGTWGGPHFSRDVRGTFTDSWWKLHWGDGMHIQIDPNDWRVGYTEAENGSFRRYNVETRAVEYSRPARNNITNYGDYITPEIEELQRNAGFNTPFRFNWRSPLVMSVHNSSTLYLCGNHLFKTIDRGYHWQIISPDLSTADPVKFNRESGGLTRDITGAETHCSITAFSESPISPDLLWAGTDDGNIQFTRNGGSTWENVRQNIPAVPEGIWVSHVEASHFEEGTCYVTFDGHRSSHFDTWIFRTTDFGETWENITNNLPENQSLYVVREDPKNKNLLFAGSEFACFVTLDGGKSWQRLMNNMPTVAFHDLVIHPRDGDLIAGTHGRSIWVLDDITPLQQLTEDVAQSEAHLFSQRPATIWEDASRGGVRGHRYFAAENPPYIPKRDDVVRAKMISGGLISYYLKNAAADDVILEITDISGKNKRTMHVPGDAGINRTLWDLRFDPSDERKELYVDYLKALIYRISDMPKLSRNQKRALSDARNNLENARQVEEYNSITNDLRSEFGHFVILRRAFGRRLQGDAVKPGEYKLRLTLNGTEFTGKITVRRDPIHEK